MTTATATAWPLFDLFLDLPHPAASPSCPPPFSIDPPDSRSEVVKKELGGTDGIARIARFAFPEHDDRAPPPPPPPTSSSAGLNRHDVYWIQHSGFSCHSFSLQTSNGTRVHGHVRRYLPSHLQASTRWDVGRRGVRALVLITRANGGEQLFGSLLKSVEAISSQQAATPRTHHPSSQPQKAFLNALHQNHVAVCRNYLEKAEDQRAPMVLTLQGAEFGNCRSFLEIDTSRFLLPTSLLKPGESMVAACTVSPILPLLRCCGIPNSLRLLSALLSERRVLMVSASPTRLTNCARSALSMLAQGSLYWQHLFLPVLPPHLQPYLAAPMPYLIGILNANLLQGVPEIGEVLILHLDTNEMETRGMAASQVFHKIPDLCSRSSMMMLTEPTTNNTNMDAYQQQQQQQQLSPSEELAKDLTEICKADKRAISGESALQEGTKEAVKKVGRAFSKFKEKGRAYLAKQSGSEYDAKTPPPSTPEDNTGATATTEVNPQDSDYVYTESSQNEAAEEEARIAFTSFFLYMIGDMRWYLSPPQPGQAPVLDRDKFVQSRKALGDVEGTPMFPLVVNFVQTQMFEQFAKERVEQVSQQVPVTRDAPLFVRCSHQHRVSRIDFSHYEIRRVCREMAQTNPSRFLIQSNATARRLAMSLTSNAGYPGNYQEALTRLTESCREASAVLFDVMSVVWMRIRDSKGMQWKHGLQALHILRNLILHGPLAAVAEATDGLDKIRALKSYQDNLRAKQVVQVREAATQVYALLVDRAMLFWARRVCANARRVLKNPPQASLKRDSRLRVNIPFQHIHAAVAPTGHRPSAAPPAPARQAGRPQQQQQQQQRRSHNAVANPVVDLLGIAAPAEPAQTVAHVQQQSNQVLGMFDSMSVSSSLSGPSAATPPPPAFAQPTIAQLPNKASAPPAFAQPPPTGAVAPRYAQQQQPTPPGPGYAPQQQQQQQQPHGASRAPPPAASLQPTFAQIPPKAIQPLVAVQQAPSQSAYNPQQAPAATVPRQPAAYNPQQAGGPPAARPPQPYHAQGGQGAPPPAAAAAYPGQAAAPYPPQPHAAAYPQQQQQPQPGYAPYLPGQQPRATTNLFAAAPPPAVAAPAPTPAAAPAQSKFDPLRKDPFA